MSALGILVAVIVPLSAQAQTHKGFNFQGYVKTPAGAALNTTGATITIQLLSPNNCVLMEESHSNVNITDGFLNLVIGNGTRGGSDKGYTLATALNNSVARTGLDQAGQTAGSGGCNYTPSGHGQDARKVRLSFLDGSETVVADFAVRGTAYAVESERLEGRSATDFVQVNSAKNLTQAKVEDFFDALTNGSSQGNVKWNGSSFVSYDPTSGADFAGNSIPGTAVASLPWSKLTSVPAGLTEIGGLSCVDGKILKRASGAWTCADDATGGGGGGSGTVTSVALGAPSGIFSVSGSPVTSSGTLSFTLDNQAAATVLAGPASGGAAAPAFRSLTINDIRSSNTGSFLNASGSCGVGEALTYLAPSDTIECASVGVTSSQVTTALGYTPVDKAGDTMTGTLNLPTNGLKVGTDQLVIASGKVGVGTTAPTLPFEVHGGTASNDHGAPIGFYGQDANGVNKNGGNIVLVPGQGAGGGDRGHVIVGNFSSIKLDSGSGVVMGKGFIRGNSFPDFLALGAASTNTPAIYVNDANFVGLNTQVPTSLLHGNAGLAAATGDEIAYRFDYITNKATSGNDTGLLISMTDTASPGISLPLDIKVGGSTKFSVDSTGGVAAEGTVRVPAGDISTPSIVDGSNPDTGIYFGLGTVATPAVQFVIDGAQRFELSNSIMATPNIVRFLGDNSVGYKVLGNDEFSIFTSDTERLTVIADGKVGIGTTAPDAIFDVVDSSTTTSAIIVPRAGNFTGTAVDGMVRYNTTAGAFQFRQGGSWITATDFSDQRLKTNITPVENALDLVNKLNPVYFDWDLRNPRTQSFNQKHQVGFIAQEVEQVLPEVVNVGKDSYRTVEYGKIVSVVVAAVQELFHKVLGLEAAADGQQREIASLKSENEKLRRDNEAIKSYLCSKDPDAPICN